MSSLGLKSKSKNSLARHVHLYRGGSKVIFVTLCTKMFQGMEFSTTQSGWNSKEILNLMALCISEFFRLENIQPIHSFSKTLGKSL